MAKGYTEKHADRVERMSQLITRAIRESVITEEQLPSLLADAWAHSEELEENFEELADTFKEDRLALNVFSGPVRAEINDPELARTALLKMFEESGNEAARRINVGTRLKRKSTAKRAAEARHSRPGGSRDIQQSIREIWASGKYSSRDLCAEQECAALGISFSTARKALRNTPDT